MESGRHSPDVADPPPTLLDLLSEINHHRWLYGRLVSGSGQFGEGRLEAMERLADYFAALDLDRDTCRFLSGGVLGVLSSWM